MSDHNVEHPRIQHLIKENKVKVLGAEYSAEFDNYITNCYPWAPVTGYRIDWKETKKPYKRIHWEKLTEEETRNFLNTTCMGNFKEVCFIYGSRQPALLANYDFASLKLDILALFGIHVSFMVGVKRNKFNIPELVKECFVEIDSVEWLTAPDIPVS